VLFQVNTPPQKFLGTTIYSLTKCQPNFLPNSGRNSYAYRLEDLPAAAKALAADGKPFTFLIDRDIIKSYKILLDIRPLKVKLCFLKSCVQFLAKSRAMKQQKTWPRMASSV
jgi:hypothetical protein